jgi:hypothetical protein
VNIKLEQKVFGRQAYVLFLVCIVIALAFSGLPTAIFFGFVAAVVLIGAIAEILSRLASRKLAAISTPVVAPGVLEYDRVAPMTTLLVAFSQVQKEPEFARTEDWFVETAVGSFA